MKIEEIKMKRIASLCLMALLLLALLVSLCSCSVDARYENAEKYTAGSVELKADIKSLDIKWLSGEVKISYHDSLEIHVMESSSQELKTHEKLHWFVDNGTLRVRFSESGKWRFGSLSKTLEIKLPKWMKPDVEIETTSADVKLTLPDKSSFKLKFESNTGIFSSEIETRKEPEYYVSGSGEITLSVKTDSGNLNILRNTSR